MFDKFYLCESKIIMALFYVRLTVRFAVRGYLRLTLYKYVCVFVENITIIQCKAYGKCECKAYSKHDCKTYKILQQFCNG
jgi:hypothetical protein